VNQPDLFSLPVEPLPVYQAGSRTSKAAAEQARAFAPSQRDRIAAWLRTEGQRGGTQIEAEAALGIKRQSLCPRFRELEQAGLIRKTVETRFGAVVYRANE